MRNGNKKEKIPHSRHIGNLRVVELINRMIDYVYFKIAISAKITISLIVFVLYSRNHRLLMQIISYKPQDILSSGIYSCEVFIIGLRIFFLNIISRQIPIAGFNKQQIHS